MVQSHRIAAAALFAAALAGCSSLSVSSCPAGLKPVTEARLFFGRAITGGGEVSDENWRRFVDEEITPRFPDGFSVVDALGQWKDATGIVHERSKMLIVVLTGDGQDRLEAVRNAYRQRFHQDSVLLIETKACGIF